MEIINLMQGSDEWIRYRKAHITATDAPAIMGCSPYDTVYSLWLKKSGRAPAQADNAAMAFGRQKETEIRQKWENQTGETFKPVVVGSSEYSWMIASLDGLTNNGKLILECKVTNAHAWAEHVKKGRVPDYMYCQAQHQLAVTGAECVQFVFFSPSTSEYLAVEVFPDEEFIENMILKEREFYEEHLLKDITPEMTEKDSLCRSDDPEWLRLEQKAKDAYFEYQEKKREWESLKKEFIDISDDGNCHGDIISLTRTAREGAIDYKKMQEDGIDIQKYRKPSIGFWTVRVNTKDKNE